MRGHITSSGHYIPSLRFLYVIKSVISVGYMMVFLMVVMQSTAIHADMVHERVMGRVDFLQMMVVRFVALILLAVMSLWIANVAISLRKNVATHD